MSKTAEERAKQLVARYGTLEDLPYGEEIRDELISEITLALCAHANAALEACELLARKQGCWCARLAEQPHGSVPHCGLNPCPHAIADAIRALKEE